MMFPAVPQSNFITSVLLFIPKFAKCKSSINFAKVKFILKSMQNCLNTTNFNTSCYITCEVSPLKNRDRVQSYFNYLPYFFQIVQVLLIIVENLKIHNIKVKFTCNFDIYLITRKLVYFLLYIGAPIDADVVININIVVIIEYNLYNVLAINVRNWTTIQYASNTWFLLAACYSNL